MLSSPDTHPRKPNGRKAGKYTLAILVAAGLVFTSSAVATPTPTVRSSETRTKVRLNEQKPVSTANGVLTFQWTGKNPYTGAPEKGVNDITNPFVVRLGKSALKRNGNNLIEAGKIAFGYEDVCTPETTVHFVKFDPATMQFTPNHGNDDQVRPVTFDFKNARLDYTHPFGANHTPYKNQLFGISASTGTPPSAVCPRP